MRGSTNREETTVHPFLNWSKIQEGFPAHCSDLQNKELGYDTLIDKGDGEPIKLRNCVCSARPNSELFKRFSRNLAQNIKREVDQLFIFTSLSARCRLQTSIGTAGNPGIFLMAGLTYLDEKYKEAYHRCEIELSFLEFRDTQVYDLLCSTGQTLLTQRNADSKRFEGFGEHWVKTSTFSQFIKYFKIALFNNKERDFGGQIREGNCRTSFVMRIRSSLYDTDDVLIRQQQSTLVDYQLSPLRQKQKTGRTILDYFLIQANNCNPSSKQIHYHLVQQHPLLLLLKKFLPQRNSILAANSQVVFLFSIPARKDLLDSSRSALDHIQAHISQQWELPFQGRTIRTARFDREVVKGQLENIISGISLNTYTSLRAFNSLRKWLSSEARRCQSLLRQFRKLIVQYIRQQLQLQFLQNQLVGHNFKLVGSCIKSDHFKDFYKAKSYLQLSREVSIKTEGTRQHILQKITEIQFISRKFEILQAKELENLTKAEGLNQIQKPSEQGKFKKVGVMRPQNQRYQLLSLVKSLLDYVGRLWDLVCLQRPRTTKLCVKLEQQIVAEEQDLSSLLSKFCNDIQALRETEVLYEQQNNQFNNNDVTLFRSLDFLGLLGNKNKNKTGQFNVGKRLLIKKQVRRQNSTNLMPHVRHHSPSQSRLPSIMKPLIISGDLKISNFILTPLQTIQSQIILEPDGHN